MQLRSDALKITRELLPKNKSLIGFIGGPWTVASYGTGMNKGVDYQGGIKNKFIHELLEKKIFPLLRKNIELQITSGAEIVMIFDTDASRIGNSEDYKKYSKTLYKELILPYGNKVGYFAKHPFDYNYFIKKINSDDEVSLSGIGVDHTKPIYEWLGKTKRGFVQGNFNQDDLTKSLDDFKFALDSYIEPITKLSIEERAGWVCGLGHGILKTTPEENVKYFIKTIRETFK
jgi:uroporphyrinogen decarboxylase